LDHCADPLVHRFAGAESIGEVRARMQRQEPQRVRVAGRALLVRDHGGLVFVRLRKGARVSQP